MTWSIDLRQKALETKKREMLSYGETAKRFGVSVSSLARWATRLEPKSVRNNTATKINTEALKQDVTIYPDAYHHERAERLKVSKSGVARALQRMRISYKKNPGTSQSK